MNIPGDHKILGNFLLGDHKINFKGFIYGGHKTLISFKLGRVRKFMSFQFGRSQNQNRG